MGDRRLILCVISLIATMGLPHQIEAMKFPLVKAFSALFRSKKKDPVQKIKNQTSKKEEKVESQTPEDEKKIENRISLKLSKAFNPCANTMDLRNILGLPSTVQSLPPIKNEDEEDGDEKCDDPLEEGRKSMSSQDFTPADRLKVEEETKKNKGMRHLLRNLDGICKEFETEKMVSKTELENWPKNEKEKADS